MSSVLTQNYFELFSLPQRYVVDRAVLDARYRELQRSVHPDRFASSSDQERRISMQQAAHINEAYQVLKDPLKRGRYMLELGGHTVASQQVSHQDPAFLMQQMELRERLGEVREQQDPLKALDQLAKEIRDQYQVLESGLADALEVGRTDLDKAFTLVQQMQFFTRLRNEIQELEADLEDELL